MSLDAFFFFLNFNPRVNPHPKQRDKTIQEENNPALFDTSANCRSPVFYEGKTTYAAVQRLF